MPRIPAAEHVTTQIDISRMDPGLAPDGNELFSTRDSTFIGLGKVGLWTKADSVTYFDRIAIAPLD